MSHRCYVCGAPARWGCKYDVITLGDCTYSCTEHAQYCDTVRLKKMHPVLNANDLVYAAKTPTNGKGDSHG